MSSDDLQKLRQKIDAVDDQMMRLLIERAALVQQVGDVKAQSQTPVFRPEREAAILSRMVAANTSALPEQTITAIWLEIISGCRALERVMRIAYLGPAGT